MGRETSLFSRSLGSNWCYNTSMNKLLILQVLLLSLFSFTEINKFEVASSLESPLEKRKESNTSATSVTIIDVAEESENLTSRQLHGPLALFVLESLSFFKSTIKKTTSFGSSGAYVSHAYSPILPRSPPLV